MHPQQYPQQPYASEPYDHRSYPQKPYPQQPYAQASYPQHGTPYQLQLVATRPRAVNDILPGFVPGLLGGLQLVLWLAIVGLEAGGLYYDPLRGTAYAGFWCSIIFFDTWISMFCYLCCGKSNGCAIYLLVQNIINMICSVILMAFTAYFVQNPCSCYFSTLCVTIDWISVTTDILGFGGCASKLPLLKGLLACAIIMFLSSIAYIIAYIGISIWLCAKRKSSVANTEVKFQGHSQVVQIGQPQPYVPIHGQQYGDQMKDYHDRSNPDNRFSSPTPHIGQYPVDQANDGRF
ncbi:hypothetical protein I4U23_031384 [Adineta vaga]|nr:hypothetical protein I4U23_031384 [Adineta vaga]